MELEIQAISACHQPDGRHSDDAILDAARPLSW
jgi:hypothetical protein